MIINDPFVSAAHISLNFNEGAWECENTGSVNGIFVSRFNEDKMKIRVDKSCRIASGDTIYLGKTSIRVWDSNHPVAPEQVLDGGSFLPFDTRKTPQSLLFNFGFFSFVCYLYLTQWFWKREYSFSQVIAGVCLILFCLVIWAAFWALITRFTKRQHRFQQHLIFSFQWAVISIAVTFPLKFIFFYVCSSSFDYIAGLVYMGLFSVFVLYNHLSIGTNLSFFKRIMISSLIAMSMIFLTVLGYYATHNEFSPQPRHYVKIVPVSKNFVPTISVNEEVKRLDTIF